MSQPLAGQSGNLIAGFGQVASKDDVLAATDGVQEDIGNIFDDLDGFGDRIDAVEIVANDASDTADVAYAAASYWETECVVASAAVVLGLNELFIGLCQNVPTGKQRIITDLHIALQSQANGLTIQTKKYNAAGTSSSVIRTDTLTAGQIRASYNNIGANVLDKERIFWNVTSITGSVEPLVLQILVFGVIIDL